MGATFTKDDLVPAVQTATEQGGGGFDVSQIEGLMEKVLSIGEKAQRFQALFGKAPESKSELRYANTINPSVAGLPSPASQETVNREFALKLQEIDQRHKQELEDLRKSFEPKKEIIKETETDMIKKEIEFDVSINQDKINILVDQLIANTDNMPEFVKAMPISKGIDYLKSNKPLITKLLIEKIPECIEIKQK